MSPGPNGPKLHRGDWSRIYPAIILILVAEFFIGLPDATAIDPPLLRVEITALRGSQDQVVGMLIAHADGAWHFFDEQGKLRAVPDENVLSVRISDEGEPLRPALPEDAPTK